MQNNLRNRSVALASTFALALTGIVATAPAAQAQTPVDLAPKSGTQLGAFITDDLEMDLDIPQPLDPAFTAIEFVNPKSEVLQVEFSLAQASSVTLRAYDATGAQVDLDNTNDLISKGTDDPVQELSNYTLDKTEATAGTGKIVVDFTGFTRLVAYDLKGTNQNKDGLGTSAAADRTVTFAIQPLEVADTDATDRGFEWGAGNQGDITVTAWNEISASANYDTVDSSTASASLTTKWYDPRGVAVVPSIERYVGRSGETVLNDPGNQTLGGKITFNRSDINLDQIDFDQWDLSILDAGVNEVEAAGILTNHATFAAGRGSSSGSHDAAGAVYWWHDDGAALETTSLYTVRIEHKDDNTANTRVFSSAGYSVPTTSLNPLDIFASVTPAADSQQVNVAPGTTNGKIDQDVELRPGAETLTYTARLYDSNSTDRAKEASELIAAVVTAGSYMPDGTELTVSGSSQKLDAPGTAVIATGLTDSNGDFSVNVTSSNPVALTSYEVDFYALDDSDNWVSTFRGTGLPQLNMTYKAAAVDGADSLKLVNDVLAGSTVSVDASVTDIFGQPANTNDGDDLYITVQATDTSDLDETAKVGADGKASISFDNFVATGESDILTVYLHEGASFISANITSKTVSLYNPAAASGLNVPADVTGSVTYDDFITGTASATNVAPDDTPMEITGTVVDASGAGVPGALVTVDADGMQLRNKSGGDYFVDSITYAADAAGRFTVQLWSQSLAPAGQEITINAGGLSETLDVKTYLPENLSGGNLVFTLDAPANIDVNKTYAIQASLTDKWGNPVQTSGGTVDIVGVGSVEINSDAKGAVDKSFGRDGKVTVFVRSIKDIEGPGTITATLKNADYATGATSTSTLNRTEAPVDNPATAHDETSFSNEIEFNINVGEAAATSSDQKVNAGSFKGYVALYAKGYEGQRMSAIVAGKWLQVDSLASSFERVVRFTGAGYDIKVRIYIDGNQVGPEFNILTK